MKPILTFLTLLVLVAARAAEKPNIIVIMADDLGYGDLSCYGATAFQTPNIDRFATRAMRFTDAYAQPLCSPTRCSLLTGKYSARHGITSATGHQPPQPAGYRFLPDTAAPNQPVLLPESKNFMAPGEYTLAEALRDAGVRVVVLTMPSVTVRSRPSGLPMAKTLSPTAIVSESPNEIRANFGASLSSIFNSARS